MKMRWLWYVCLLILIVTNPLFAEVHREKFTADGNYLIVETLDDDLIHFELFAVGAGPEVSAPIHNSPMIHKTDYAGPSSYLHDSGVIETAEIEVRVNTQNLCTSVTDKTKNRLLTTICPLELGSAWKGLTLTKEQIENVYGLGQQFKVLRSADGDWLSHRVRDEQPAGQAQSHGNGFMPFGPAGLVGNIQIPVLYAVGSDNLNYALLLDNVYKQRWDFEKDPWEVRMWGDQIRFYVLTGQDLRDLRKDYMELVGTPPVPPRKAFGLWVSEFGYKNWRQIDSLRAGLRRDGFPVDGFVLDLQWFGGVTAGSPDSKMGKLDWDQDLADGNGFYFPDPDANIAFLDSDNIGLVVIEESYVNENTDTFAQMRAEEDALLAYARKDGRCDASSRDPILLVEWFGKAGMIDWSNPDAGAWVHENRRFPNLVRKGIIGHWTDLGEPEKYDPSACYHGVELTPAGPKNGHGDIHNLYAFLWNKSIYDGYARRSDLVNRRPFMVSRSGAAGSGRFGVAMWSGDIGSNLDLLATHLNAQMHMSFSGIDYYGSDIGGFRREGIPYNGNHSGNLQYQDELYTQWFANGCWFDVPVRPHTDNSFQQTKRYETAPNLVGNTDSNRENLLQRYELIPYYYSLAYRADLYGEPLVPPLVFYYQDDQNVRQIGHEKLIGKDLLVAVVASHGEYARNVYLPKGKWINFHTREWFESSGQWINSFPTYIGGIFRLPVFARAGAIIPMIYVDEDTKDAFGHRKDASSRDELVVRIYADQSPSQFTLYEDDGSTLRYGTDGRPVYETRTTVMSQQQTATGVTVVIDEANGTYSGAPAIRNNIVQLVVEDAQAVRVKLNGLDLPERISVATFEGATNGWYNAARNVILMKSGIQDVVGKKTFEIALRSLSPVSSVNFVCDNGWTALGEDIYAVGNKPELGNWDPNMGVKLFPNVYYEYIYNPPPDHSGPGPSTPKWTRLVQGLPSNTVIEWKCVKKLNSGEWEFEPGDNHVISLPASGFGGTNIGSF
jgi:alpha-glucosidase (family GH31 glycosyl hydrolase)